MKIWDIIFWTFIILALFLLAWHIFGGSPDVVSLITVVIGSELALWKMNYEHGRELSGIKKDIEYARNELKKDIFEIKEAVNDLKNMMKK